MSTRRKRLDAAIDRLAGLFDGGHLLAASIPENLLDGASEELERGRRFRVAFDAWAHSPDGCGGDLFDAMLRARDAVDADAHLAARAAGTEGDDGES